MNGIRKFVKNGIGPYKGGIDIGADIIALQTAIERGMTNDIQRLCLDTAQKEDDSPFPATLEEVSEHIQSRCIKSRNKPHAEDDNFDVVIKGTQYLFLELIDCAEEERPLDIEHLHLRRHRLLFNGT